MLRNSRQFTSLCVRLLSSTSGGKDKSAHVDFFENAKKTIYKNRQQIVNIAGIWLVLSYSIYSYRVNLAWNEREFELKKFELENSIINAALIDENWMNDLEDKVRNGCSLKQELSKRIPLKVDIESQREKLSSENDSAILVAGLGSIVGGLGDKNSDGRIL